MVMHVIHALSDISIDRTVVVVGHGAERVTKKVQEQAPGWAHVTFVEQTVQRGTGDAATVGMTAIPGDDLDDDSTIIVLPGDTPLLRAETVIAAQGERLRTTLASIGDAVIAGEGQRHRVRDRERALLFRDLATLRARRS